VAKKYIIQKDETLKQSENTIPIVKHVDVLVAGGGTSGFIAAIAAARNGAKTLLVEWTGVLGGTGTAGMMTVICGTSWAGGISKELIDRINAAGGAPSWDEIEENIPFDPLGRGATNLNRSQSTPFDPEVYKRIALEMILEAGVDPLFYCLVSDVIVDDGEVRGVVIESKKGREAILAKTVIDCTGDADIAVKAGSEFVTGREDDNKMRPVTLLFRVGGLDIRTLFKWAEEHPDQIQPMHRFGQILKVDGGNVIARLSGFYDFCSAAQERGELPKEIHYLRFENAWIERGISLINSTRIYEIDGVDPWQLSRARLIGDQQVQQIISFIRKYFPGCQNAFLIDSATLIGVRETRRIVGEYVLSNDDVYNNANFHDSIMRIRRNIQKRGFENAEAHPPEPVEGSKEDIYERDPDSIEFEKHIFDIPFRCLLPKGINNLLVAGRCISVTHDIDSTTRNQLICMRMGQVAGTAAALGLKEGTSANKIDVKKLQHNLYEEGMKDFEPLLTK
jgi:glycine/D-amino acid oxidase-like deaminating enzyme